MLKVIGGAQEGEFKAVASGTLPNGKPVVVNADGTVSVVAASGGDPSVGSSAVFETASIVTTGATFDSNSNKVVITYQDLGNSGYGTAVVGTVSGTSISFGTPTVFASASVSYFNNATIFDSNSNKVVVAYRNPSDNNRGYAIVGTVSGTSISFGTAVLFETGITAYIGATFDSNSNKVVIVFRDDSNSNYGKAIVGTVSGTSISYGAAATYYDGTSSYNTATFDSNSNKVVIAYQRGSAGNCIVGTVSGTSISFGTTVQFDNSTSEMKPVFDSDSNKVVVAYSKSNAGKAVVGTVSGTSISFGTAVQFNATAAGLASVFDSDSNKVVVAYYNSGNSNYGEVIVGTVSGTDISFGSAVALHNASTTQIAATFDTNSNKVTIAYKDGGNSNYGTASVFSTDGTNLTSENYIGMSSGPASPSGFGTAAIFETGATDDIVSVYDSTNNRHVIVYQDEGNSNHGTAVVATVSGNTVSFGTPVVFKADVTSYYGIAFDSTNDKVVVFYRDTNNSGYLNAVVGTVSGTSISFGTAVVADSTSASFMSAAFDSINGKVVCTWYDSTNTAGIVGTVSGTSISFGTKVTVNTGGGQYTSTVYEPNAGKVVATYRAPTTNNGAARVGTVSGTSISYGTEATFNSGNTEWRCSVFDPTTDKIAILYKDAADSDKGKIVVGTVSGTSISFGSEVQVTSGNMFTSTMGIASNPSGKLVMVYRDVGNSDYGTLRTGTISGTTVTLDTAQVYSEVNSQHNVISYNSVEDRMLVAYSDAGGNDQGIGQVYNVGFAGEVADGGTASIDIIGSLSTNQGGLTAGQQYFVQTDGTIGLTAADPSVLAGTAISATELLVKT